MSDLTRKYGNSLGKGITVVPTNSPRTALATRLPSALTPVKSEGHPRAYAARNLSEQATSPQTQSIAAKRSHLIASAAQLIDPRNTTRALGNGQGSAPATNTAPLSRVSVEGWQAEAWAMYDSVGELRYLAHTLAGLAGQARLYVGKKSGEDLSEKPDDLPAEVLQAFADLGGSRSNLAAMVERLALNLFITGDGWIVGIPAGMLGESDPMKARDLRWSMLSIAEVSRKGEDRVTLTVGAQQIEAPLSDIALIRVWRSHPRNAWEADSPTRSSLPVLRELVGLTMHVSAQIDSRLAGAGVLVVPESASRSLPGNDASLDPMDDPITESLMVAMQTAIRDRDAASALVPIVLKVPDEVTGSFQHLSFANNLDSEARELRDEAIRRLALGMDAPPEVLLGTDGMNHWGAWLIQEETIGTHLGPVLSMICDALTTQYLIPALSGTGVDASQFAIGFDVEHLIARPTRSADAQRLFELGEISGTALRSASGFSEDDVPFPEMTDPARRAVLEMVKADPALFISPGIGALLDEITKLINNEPIDPLPMGVDAEGKGGSGAATPGEIQREETKINGSQHNPLNQTSGASIGAPKSVGTPSLGAGSGMGG